MSADPLLGKLVAQRYRLISRLGSGGMASVYLARHVLIERLSAIKFLRADLGGDSIARDRFLREARAVNRLNHPNIVEITDYGEADGLVYLVMEYVPGEPLERHLVRGPIGWRRAASIGLQTASALGRAHQMGVIHRDLKPANVLLIPRRSGDDIAKLTDFGVAKVAGAPTITTSSVALGTPGYVAPEYQELGNLDARSDLFSLGVLLYEATSGYLPFGKTVAQPGGPPIAKEPAERLTSRGPGTPEFFDDVVQTLLARDPDDRPRDGYEAFDLLRRAVEREGVVLPTIPPKANERGPSTSPLAYGSGAESPRPPTAEMPISQPELSAPPPRRGPHLVTLPFDRVGSTCGLAMARLERVAHEAKAPTPAAKATLQHAEKLVTMVSEIARMVTLDARALDDVGASAREIRARLGKQIDEVGRERSKALGWAGTIAERTWVVQARRQSGEHSVPAQEAMVWEQAALEHEEEKARARADELGRSLDSLRAELGKENERLEHEVLVATARLDGHIAALRSLALEAWVALEDAAGRYGADPAMLLS